MPRGSWRDALRALVDRRRGAEGPRGTLWRARGKRLLRFLRVLAVKSRDDAITLKAAALAFVTLLSLVPLLAAFSFIGAQVLDRYEDVALSILTQLLPYSEASVLTQLRLWVEQAEALQHFGLLTFLVVGLGAFVTIEETINNIWQVSSRRSLRAKLLSFTLLVFWGPLLIGSTLSAILVLRQRPAFDLLFRESLLVQSIPLAITLLGFSMLYWQVPFTPVRFGSALLGGAVATALLELLRRSFTFYVLSLTQLTYVVYGGFALAIFFMVSVQLAWWAVLLGAEVAYVHQHFAALTRTRRLDSRFREPWIGLAVLVTLTRELREGRPITDLDGLAERLGISPEGVREALAPLLDAGLIAETAGEPGGFVLARDPHSMQLATVFEAYDRPIDELFGALPEELGEHLGAVLARLRDHRRLGLAERRLVELAP
jgi:membrane protein